MPGRGTCVASTLPPEIAANRHGKRSQLKLDSLTSPLGLGRVKTKSDLVVMPSGRQIFAFFCSPHDRRAQNSGCGYTAWSFYTARVISDVLSARQAHPLCPRFQTYCCLAAKGVQGRVEMWRGGCRLHISVAASFDWRCLSGSTMAPFPHPAHRTGQADFPHPALGQDFTLCFRVRRHL